MFGLLEQNRAVLRARLRMLRKLFLTRVPYSIGALGSRMLADPYRLHGCFGEYG